MSKKMYIPIYEESHCYLVTCEDLTISLMDPYNFPNSSKDKKENHKNHLKLLKKLKDQYFHQLYTRNHLECPNFKLSVMVPPELAIIVKYSLQKKLLIFDTDDILRMRTTMRKELIEEKILVEPDRSKYNPNKRKPTNQNTEKPKKNFEKL